MTKIKLILLGKDQLIKHRGWAPVQCVGDAHIISYQGKCYEYVHDMQRYGLSFHDWVNTAKYKEIGPPVAIDDVFELQGEETPT